MKQRSLVSALLCVLLLCSMLSPAFSAAATEPETETETEAKVTETKTLTIHYRLDSEDGSLIAESYVAQLPKSAAYEETAPQELNGYVLSAPVEISGTLEEDTVYNVVYNHPDMAEYTVRYLADIRSVHPGAAREVELKTEVKRGPVGSFVTVPARYFPSYQLDASRESTICIQLDRDPAKNVLTIYYTCTEPIHMRFDTGDGGNYIPAIIASPETEITGEVDRVLQADPTRDGYSFVRWNPDLRQMATMPGTNLVVTAEWKPATSNYTVMYMMESQSGDYAAMDPELLAQANRILSDCDCGFTLPTIVSGQTDSTVPLLPAFAEATSSMTLLNISFANPSVRPAELSAYPFYGFAFNEEKTKQEATASITADGTAVLYAYFDRQQFAIYLHDNPEPDYFYEEGEFLPAYPTSTSDDIWAWEMGDYSSVIPEHTPDPETKRGVPTMAEIKQHYEELYGDTYGEFLGLTDIPGYVSWRDYGKLQLYSTRIFTREWSPGMREHHFFPVFTGLGNPLVPIHVSYYYEKVDPPQNGNLIDNYNRDIRADDTALRKDSILTTLEILCSGGFQWSGGYYRIAETPEQLAEAPLFPLEEGWINNSMLKLDISKEIVTTSHELYVEVFQQRKHYPVTYYCSIHEQELLGKDAAVRYGAAHTFPGEGSEAVLAHIQMHPEIGEHYQFGGWVQSPELVHAGITVERAIMPARGVVLYARWVPKERTVNFYDAEGADAKMLHSVTVETKTPVAEPQSPPAAAITSAAGIPTPASTGISPRPLKRI